MNLPAFFHEHAIVGLLTGYTTKPAGWLTKALQDLQTRSFQGLFTPLNFFLLTVAVSVFWGAGYVVLRELEERGAT
jgi:hypothetical protein